MIQTASNAQAKLPSALPVALPYISKIIPVLQTVQLVTISILLSTPVSAAYCLVIHARLFPSVLRVPIAPPSYISDSA